MLPALFVGHGSPMHALEENRYTHMLRDLGQSLPKPAAVLCVSAHWQTEGSWVTAMDWPRTIHDFYGFPKELSDIQYSAPGSPHLATLVQELVPFVRKDPGAWGLDHGAWAVLRHMYPKADIPVAQLSLDLQQPARFHYELGRSLRPLREKNILILGSGNVVHNLREIRRNDTAHPAAAAFEAWIEQKIMVPDHVALIEPTGKEAAFSIPTPEHYYPLLYALGAAGERAKIRFPYRGIEMGSISMLSVELS